MRDDYSRRIFQTWKTSHVPDHWKEGQASVLAMNPGWDYTLLTDADNDHIVATHFPWFVEKFRSFPYGIQRADAIRYVILFLYGGMYIDLDYLVLKPFDSLAGILASYDIVLMRSTNTPSIITNSVMFARAPGHPFWLQCISAMMTTDVPWFFGKHLVVFKTTGPFMLSKVYDETRGYNISVRADISVPCNICNIDKCPKDTKYVVMPLAGSSWASWDTKIYIWFFCGGFTIIVAILLVLYVILYYRRKRGSYLRYLIKPVS